MDINPKESDFAGASQLVVLLVDDESDLLTTLSVVLEKHNYQVLKAQSGVEALAILDEHTLALGSPGVDIIVSDLQMPEMDGIELLDKVKTSDYKDIPFLILSGTLDSEKASLLITLGVDGILYKPFDGPILVSEIKKTITRCLKRKNGAK